MERAFQQKKLGGITLENSFIKTATYEGMYDNGLPNQKLTDHHVAMAKGRVGLTTVSYGAVSSEGRTFKNQMYINSRSLEKLQLLAAEVHKAGGKVSIQLTHCGYFSNNKEVKRPLAPSRIFNAYGFLSGLAFSKAMSISEMDKTANDFAIASLKLKEIGFDAVEIHMGHGYLLSQFLSPWSNRRKDDYGGSIENRVKFPVQVLRKVREKVGSEFPVLVKLNLSDGFKGGFSLNDCRYTAKVLQNHGCDGIVLSGGFTSKTPFFMMRGDVPLKGMIRNGDSVTEQATMAVFGPLLVKKYAFEPNFFLDQAIEIRKAVKIPLVYLGGVDSKQGIIEILNAGFDFIAIGRPLIHDPNFLLKIQSGEIEKTGCTRCNECVVEMDREGIKCVLEDAPSNWQRLSK